MHELIKKRRSVRKFTDQPVTKEQLKTLLEAAMYAPSAQNKRPWEFVVITNKEIIRKIPTLLPNARMCDTATAVIAVVGIPQSDMPVGYIPGDCGAASQNILLEAANIGLGACWCGVYPRDERMSEARKLLNIPEPKIPFNVIAIGVPNEEPELKGKYEEERVRYID